MTTNTFNTTDGQRIDIKSDAAVDRPITGTTQPGLGVAPAISEPDLESRVTARRAELRAKLVGLKADTRREAIEARDKLKMKLSELAHIIKWGVVDGWASLGGPVTHRLDQWLAESALQLVIKNEQSA
jgi:hypothetical protein